MCLMRSIKQEFSLFIITEYPESVRGVRLYAVYGRSILKYVTKFNITVNKKILLKGRLAKFMKLSVISTE